MTVLITGGAGYIGSHTAWRLADAGEHVVIVDNLSSGSARHVPPNAVFVRGDAGDKDLIVATIQDYAVDAIMHFAAWSNLPNSFHDPAGYYANNTAVSLNLIRAAIAANVRRFVFSSSAAVYGVSSDVPVSETAPLLPSSPYGRSKLMTEHMLADVAVAHDFEYVALRYFNVAGADPRLRTGPSSPTNGSLMKVASEAAIGRRPALSIFGTDYPTPDGSCIRDFIHVSDIAAAHDLALQYLRANGKSRALNCGYGNGYSVLQVADAFRALSEGRLRIRIDERRPGDIASITANADAIKSALGWVPKFNCLPQIARHALAWEQAQHARAATI